MSALVSLQASARFADRPFVNAFSFVVLTIEGEGSQCPAKVLKDSTK